jgi:hypothetical protein
MVRAALRLLLEERALAVAVGVDLDASAIYSGATEPRG